MKQWEGVENMNGEHGCFNLIFNFNYLISRIYALVPCRSSSFFFFFHNPCFVFFFNLCGFSQMPLTASDYVYLKYKFRRLGNRADSIALPTPYLSKLPAELQDQAGILVSSSAERTHSLVSLCVFPNMGESRCAY